MTQSGKMDINNRQRLRNENQIGELNRSFYFPGVYV